MLAEIKSNRTADTRIEPMRSPGQLILCRERDRDRIPGRSRCAQRMMKRNPEVEKFVQREDSVSSRDESSIRGREGTARASR